MATLREGGLPCIDPEFRSPMHPRRTLAALFLVFGLAAPTGNPAAGELIARLDPAIAKRPAIAFLAAVVPVSFVFATREEGHELLLNDVHVVIICPVAGPLFDGVSEGPFLIANVPDGRYEIVASHDGRARRLALTVAGEPRRVSIYW